MFDRILYLITKNSSDGRERLEQAQRVYKHEMYKTKF